MTPEAFVESLDREVKAALSRIEAKSSSGELPAGVEPRSLLVVALKNELEASEEAAAWMVDERDVEVKLALARQCGDEAKHYRLIAERLRALGVDVAAIDPIGEGWSPMYRFLRSLSTTVERVAAGQFTREALAIVRNEVFAEWCAERGDEETARLYREVIGPDEAHHHALGRALLPRFAIDEEAQSKARAAAMRTLELAEELQEVARMKKGLCRLPGC